MAAAARASRIRADNQLFFTSIFTLSTPSFDQQQPQHQRDHHQRGVDLQHQVLFPHHILDDEYQQEEHQAQINI